MGVTIREMGLGLERLLVCVSEKTDKCAHISGFMVGVETHTHHTPTHIHALTTSNAPKDPDDGALLRGRGEARAVEGEG